ncbi:hypothetical protein CFC21_008309 [Triticum aestivum]|uniref:F-box domain-containing protein n=2 Tax=Triticum aestivum TaxID=4565 RepID=A0A9R1DG51_WHEAT|nr:hypothetical protein CFC21_008309 [Triticum aestivum]
MEPSQRSEGASIKKPRTPPAPPGAYTGAELLGEILRRLPDMASLASAALVCKRWGRIASDPAVFRRFSSLRRPPLVGVILTDLGRERFPLHNPALRFIAAHSRHPEQDLAAAFGDFYFQRHPEIKAADEWRLRGCDGGLLLLSCGRYASKLAVYDPLECTAIFFQPPERWHTGRYAIVADEADASFQVIGIDLWVEETFAVFSSRTGKWVVLDSSFPYWGFAWPRSDEKIYVLDTKTMVWSVITAPFPVGESYCVADMAEHGGLCIVSSREQSVLLWVRDINGGWVVKKEVSLLNQFGYLKRIRRDEWMKRLRILAMKAGYVYMEFWSIRKSESYILVLNLNTVKLQQFFRNITAKRYRGAAFPFFLRFHHCLPHMMIRKFKMLDSME